MIGKNEVENYMYLEWLEAREVIIATKKRKQQENAKREHQQASPRRISNQTSYRDFLFGKAAKQQKETQEVKEVVNDSDRTTDEGDGGLRRK